MFQSLRAGTPLYILHKQEPRLEVGEVISVSNPAPQFNTTYQGGVPFQNQQTTVDVKIKVESGTITLEKLPSTLTIADFGENGMVISESREAILTEVELLSKRSQEVIDSVPFHKNVLEQCDSMIKELNPTIKQEAEQKARIAQLESQMSGLRDDMVDIKGMLAKALNKKSKED